jgi:hypothetical protein
MPAATITPAEEKSITFVIISSRANSGFPLSSGRPGIQSNGSDSPSGRSVNGSQLTKASANSHATPNPNPSPTERPFRRSCRTIQPASAPVPPAVTSVALGTRDCTTSCIASKPHANPNATASSRGKFSGRQNRPGRPAANNPTGRYSPNTWISRAARRQTWSPSASRNSPNGTKMTTSRSFLYRSRGLALRSIGRSCTNASSTR